jgi:LSU ribosomal protein L14P
VMQALKADVTQGLEKGSLITCADNTGARELKVISVSGYGGTKNRHPKAGVGDKVTVSVTKGTPEMRRQVLEAVVVRQRKPIRRPAGTRVKFADNAAVVVDDAEEPRGTEIKGPIAREVAERFGSIASTATQIV